MRSKGVIERVRNIKPAKQGNNVLYSSNLRHDTIKDTRGEGSLIYDTPRSCMVIYSYSYMYRWFHLEPAISIPMLAPFSPSALVQQHGRDVVTRYAGLTRPSRYTRGLRVLPGAAEGSYRPGHQQEPERAKRRRTRCGACRTHDEPVQCAATGSTGVRVTVGEGWNLLPNEGRKGSDPQGLS